MDNPHNPAIPRCFSRVNYPRLVVTRTSRDVGCRIVRQRHTGRLVLPYGHKTLQAIITTLQAGRESVFDLSIILVKIQVLSIAFLLLACQ